MGSEQADPTMPAVDVRGASRSYAGPDGTVNALRTCDLHVAAGAMVAVMGRSGSGKTTLLNLIGALDQPTTGEIEVFGERVDRLGPAAAATWRAENVGFVFQSPGLMSTMSAIENVELGLRIAHVPGTTRQRLAIASAALDRVGLSDRMRHHPSELSGGQRQRVAIARAVALEHRLILADEPTAGLDSATASEIFELLAGLSEAGTTIVMATHDPMASDHVHDLFEVGGTVAAAPEFTSRSVDSP